MALDNLEELNQPVKAKLTLFQRVVGIAEIVLSVLTLIGIFLKFHLFPFEAEIIIISLLGLSFLYVFLPIFLFRSKKIGGHILSHIAGLCLFIALMGTLFKIENWEYSNEMYISGMVVFPPIFALLLLLMGINFKDKQKLFFYLRIGLRFLIVFTFLNYPFS